MLGLLREHGSIPIDQQALVQKTEKVRNEVLTRSRAANPYRNCRPAASASELRTRRGAAELRILPSRLDDLQRCLPRAWKALLTAGRS